MSFTHTETKAQKFSKGNGRHGGLARGILPRSTSLHGTLSTVLNKEMESVSCSSSFFTFNLYIYIINAQCRCASGWGAVSKAPIYDDEDYFLALRDFLEGGGPAAFSSEADAAGAEEEEGSGVESSFAAGFST